MNKQTLVCWLEECKRETKMILEGKTAAWRQMGMNETESREKGGWIGGAD